MKAISECGFEHPSEGTCWGCVVRVVVQSQCIPKALMKGDILCQARSGMGKTCVFIISVLQNVKHSSDVASICLSLRVDELRRVCAHERNGCSDFKGVPPSGKVPSRFGDKDRLRRHGAEEERRGPEGRLRHPHRYAGTRG